MKSLLRPFLGLFVFVAMTVSNTFCAESNTNSVVAFQKAFKTAAPNAKRSLVIHAIDGGQIRRGLSLEDVKRLFGDELTVFPRYSKQDKIKAVVFFEPAAPSPDPMVGTMHPGWYIDLVFTRGGMLEYYCLSNLDK